MTESVARMMRTLFLLTPSARFFASNALQCPRSSDRSMIFPSVGLALSRDFAGRAGTITVPQC